MKKHLLLTLLLSLCAISAFAAKAKPQTLKSPDGRIAVTFDSFKYSVSADGYQVLAPSAISANLILSLPMFMYSSMRRQLSPSR